METKTEQQFTHWSYEMICAKRKFDNMIVGVMTSTVVTAILLLIDFYEIPYILTGILPYAINLGILLIPIFSVGILVYWEKLKAAKAAYETVRVDLIREIHERIENESRSSCFWH